MPRDAFGHVTGQVLLGSEQFRLSIDMLSTVELETAEGMSVEAFCDRMTETVKRPCPCAGAAPECKLCRGAGERSVWKHPTNTIVCKLLWYWSAWYRIDRARAGRGELTWPEFLRLLPDHASEKWLAIREYVWQLALEAFWQMSLDGQKKSAAALAEVPDQAHLPTGESPETMTSSTTSAP